TIAIMVIVFLGFSRTYYTAGMVLAPLPNVLIHVHGAAFTGWLVMLAVQTGLVAGGRTDIHRKLGMWGFGLACLMVALGLLAAADQVHRGHPTLGLDPETFSIIPVTAVLLFATFVALAYRARRKPAVHKRLIMIGTIAILDAAVFRMRYAWIQSSHWHADAVSYSLLAAIMVYDWATTGRVQKVTVWASVAVVVVQQLRVPLGFSPPWHALAHAMGRLGI
ncbi:MAG: hypothetical protein P4L10_08405, partial [Acidobacteriaceae bacterium]|nr:hypothetical protein [Acidobacteriaceae bacterium]